MAANRPDHREADSDRERFEALYRGYYDQILCFVARRSDPQTARDVTADTFLVAWRRIDTLRSVKEQAWLYVTARKLLANEVAARTGDSGWISVCSPSHIAMRTIRRSE